MVRKLPSGRYQASYISPDGARVNAPTTFVKEEHADKWLAAQRTDIERETWKGPTVGVTTLRAYSWPSWTCSRPVAVYSQRRCDHAVPARGLAARVADSLTANPKPRSRQTILTTLRHTPHG